MPEKRSGADIERCSLNVAKMPRPDLAPLQEVAELPLVMTADPPHHCLAGNLARSHEPIVASSCRNSLGRCNKEIGCSEIQFVCPNLGPTDETQRPAFSDLSGPVPGPARAEAARNDGSYNDLLDSANRAYKT
jgi:hypothetical protein